MEILELIRKYKELRGQLDTKKKEETDVENELGRIEQAMWEWYYSLPPDQRPTTQSAGEHGKVTFTVQRRWSVKDAEAFERWRVANGIAWETFYKLNTASVGTFCREVEETPDTKIPEGVESYEQEVLRYRSK
jgi:hypothetical protein